MDWQAHSSLTALGSHKDLASELGALDNFLVPLTWLQAHWAVAAGTSMTQHTSCSWPKQSLATRR